MLRTRQTLPSRRREGSVWQGGWYLTIGAATVGIQVLLFSALAHEVRMRWCDPEVEVEGTLISQVSGVGRLLEPHR